MGNTPQSQWLTWHPCQFSPVQPAFNPVGMSLLPAVTIHTAAHSTVLLRLPREGAPRAMALVGVAPEPGLPASACPALLLAPEVAHPSSWGPSANAQLAFHKALLRQAAFDL